MKLQDNTTTFDLATNLFGNTDTLVNDILINYKIYELDKDLGGFEISPIYTISNSYVQYFYNNNIILASKNDSTIYEDWITGEFNNDYNEDYDL